MVRLFWVGRVFRHGVTAFVKQWEGEQAQPWGFDSTETPELGKGRHRTNSGRTNWWNLSLKKSGFACRKQELWGSSGRRKKNPNQTFFLQKKIIFVVIYWGKPSFSPHLSFFRGIIWGKLKKKRVINKWVLMKTKQQREVVVPFPLQQWIQGEWKDSGWQQFTLGWDNLQAAKVQIQYCMHNLFTIKISSLSSERPEHYHKEFCIFLVTLMLFPHGLLQSTNSIVAREAREMQLILNPELSVCHTRPFCKFAVVIYLLLN